MTVLARGLAAGIFAAVTMTSSPVLASDTVKSEKQISKPKKISDRRHPDYVRCRSEPIIGSLSRKRRICMTNAEWTNYVRTGSRNAKEFVDDNQPGFMMN